ncbi:efflux transporter outer membrane subunit [Zoogloea sp.]|uniref:efflux transporter outer membrane subunit n=1 Tax=Zoogloea sp. TaxID=49181 RepID=UPI0035AEF6D1
MKSSIQPRLLPALLSLLLGACALGPDYQRPALPVGTQLGEADPAWKTATPAAPAEDGRWWAAFDDPVLDALEAQVVLGSQNVKAYEALYRQAMANLGTAQASLSPSVTGTLGATRSATAATTASSGRGPVSSSFTFGASLSWELDVWGRIARTVEAADARLAASSADLAAARLSARSSVAQAYFQARGSERQVALLEETALAYGAFLTLTQRRHAVGVATRAEVLQAESQLHSTRAQIEEARLALRQYTHALAVLVGEVPASFILPPARGPVLNRVPATPVLYPSTVLERRPDIAAAERRVAAANAAIGAAQAARFPVLGLTGSTGFRRSDLSDLLTAGSRYWSLGPSLAAALLDGGSKQSAQSLAVATWEQAVATYRQTVLSAFQEVEDNLAAAQLLAREAEAQDAALQTAAEAERITLNQYRAGTGTQLSVLTAQAAHLSARRTASDLLTRRQLAVVQLARHLAGNPFQVE